MEPATVVRSWMIFVLRVPGSDLCWYFSSTLSSFVAVRPQISSCDKYKTTANFSNRRGLLNKEELYYNRLDKSGFYHGGLSRSLRNRITYGYGKRFSDSWYFGRSSSVYTCVQNLDLLILILLLTVRSSWGLGNKYCRKEFVHLVSNHCCFFVNTILQITTVKVLSSCVV